MKRLVLKNFYWLLLWLFILIYFSCRFISYSLNAQSQRIKEYLIQTTGFDLDFSNINFTIFNAIELNNLSLREHGQKIAEIKTLRLYFSAPKFIKKIINEIIKI